MDQLVQQALKDYAEQFGESFDPTWHPTTEKELEDRLLSSQADFNKWRAKNGRVWKTLTAIALPISNLGKIAASAAEATFPPAAAGVAGLMSLVTASEKVSEANDFLEQMFTKLEDVLNRWRIDSRHTIDDYMKEKMRQILVLILSIIARSRKVMRHGRTKRWLAGVAFGDDRKTADLMEELENLLQSEDRARLALSLSKISALWEKAISNENAAVVEKLNSSAVRINEAAYAYRLEDKLVDTGLWLKEEDLYRIWTTEETSLLMVLGGPGWGKSYLATTLIEELTQVRQQRTAKSDHAAVVAYYYFNQESTLTAMLRTMAYQLQQIDPDYKQHVIETLDQGDLRTPKETWARLFLEYWNAEAPRSVILVIDGLNEATTDEIETFAEMVRGVAKTANFRIQVAIFGLIQLWGEFDFVAQQGFIEITSKRNSQDITAYVDRELAGHRQLKRDTSEVRAEFRDLILERCDGAFEWARLLLAKCKNQGKTQIRKMLDQPLQSLNDVIKSCFDQIMGDEDLDPDMLRTLLTLLTYEKWPLRLGEIYNIIRIVTGEEHAFLWWNIVRKLSSVVRWRASRTRQTTGQSFDEDEDHIEILDEDKGWSEQTRTIWITFANATIRNYVIRQGESEMHSDDHVDRWPLPKHKSEAEMVKICIRVLQEESAVERKNWYVLVYPLRYIALHLQSLDLEGTEPDDRLEIVAGIVWIFYNNDGLRRVALTGPGNDSSGVAAFWRIWVETRQFTDVVQSWLRWASIADLDLDVKEKQWIQMASTSRKQLFSPLAEYLRHSWLHFDWSPRPFAAMREFEKVADLAFNFLVAYDNMDEQENFPERYGHFFQLESFGPSTEDLLASAEKIGPPYHGDYYNGLAVVFMNLNRSPEAIKCIELIPEDDISAWAKAWFSCTSYFKRSDYDQALHFARKASELNPHARDDIEEAIPHCLLMKGDPSEALAAARKSYNRNASRDVNQLHYLLCLTICKQYITTMEVIKDLDQIAMVDLPYSQFINLLIKDQQNKQIGLRAMGQVYLSTEAVSDRVFIEEIIKRTTQAIVQTEGEAKQVEWQNHVAQFGESFMEGGYKSSVEIQLANLSRLQETKLIPDKAEKEKLLLKTRCGCADSLYHLACKQEIENDPELSLTIDRLRLLASDAEKVDKSSLPLSLEYAAYWPGMYLGKWLVNHSSAKDESWKRYFRKPLMYYLNMLDDTHDQNDVWGLSYASAILRAAGDLQNGIALLGLIGYRQPLKTERVISKQPTASPEMTEGSKSETSNRNDGIESQVDDRPDANLSKSTMPLSKRQDDDNTHHTADYTSQVKEETVVMNFSIDIHWNCETCKVVPTQMSKLYVCRTCSKIICEQCLPTTRIHPQLGYACGNYHRFDQIWPFPKEMMNRAYIIKDDVIYLKKSWLKEIRAKWEDNDGVLESK